MKEINKLEVYYHDEFVGTLALMRDGRVAFEYSDYWIQNGFSISPLSLPLIHKVFIPDNNLEGLFGVFYDSLPDGWGRLLVDRILKKNKINDINMLTRLSLIDSNSMGALEYKPVKKIKNNTSVSLDFDQIVDECKKVLNDSNDVDLDMLYKMGGSSGGARPKVNISYKGKKWIVKFPSSMDNKNIGKQEFDYNECAKECGIRTCEYRLFKSNKCDGYYGSVRFDRNNKGRIHVVSVSGLLETSHRMPNLDYEILFKLTLKITNSFEEVKELFKRMCFNVYAHNNDDHSKNFSFMYFDGKWILTPFYDLTYSSSFNGERATTIKGKGKNITKEDLLDVAYDAGINSKEAIEIVNNIENIVNNRLLKYIK